MDSASPSRASESNRRRGCSGLAVISAVRTVSTPVGIAVAAVAGAGVPGSSVSSPRPRALRIKFPFLTNYSAGMRCILGRRRHVLAVGGEHLLGEGAVCLRAARGRMEEQHRRAVPRPLRRAAVGGDGGAEARAAEVTPPLVLT